MTVNSSELWWIVKLEYQCESWSLYCPMAAIRITLKASDFMFVHRVHTPDSVLDSITLEMRGINQGLRFRFIVLFWKPFWLSSRQNLITSRHNNAESDSTLYNQMSHITFSRLIGNHVPAWRCEIWFTSTSISLISFSCPALGQDADIQSFFLCEFHSYYLSVQLGNPFWVDRTSISP
jgi:hypothetical protein